MISIQNIELNENPFKYDQHIKIKSQKLFLIEKIGDIFKIINKFYIVVCICTLSFRSKKFYVERQDKGVREVKIQISD